MPDHALFITTDMFETVTPGANFINPRCFGEDFAVWLKARLAERAVESGAPIQEDWGWALLARQGGGAFTISIGVMDEGIGRSLAEWRVGIDYEKSQNGIGAWFRAAPTAQLQRVFAVLREIAAAERRFAVSDTES
ncbi:MAG TPA: hypothetical protein VHZ78_01600 [Rhizomicrobium sp.]|jgi:hypothetical protein|nr:hypothetical protein [Rhizomicrobium sp.]